MTASSPAVPGRIFINYRREETAYAAGWLFAQLTEHFGKDQVFKDVDSIQLGDDFVEVVAAAVGSCDVLLSLIGDQWLTVTGEDGRRRLDDPGDYVRLEIEAALTRGIRVIPILVEGARMPLAEELPASLASLVRRQALELSPSRFEYDIGRLLRVLDRTLAGIRSAPAAGPAAAAGAVPGEQGTGVDHGNVPAGTPESVSSPTAPPVGHFAQDRAGPQEPPATPRGAGVGPSTSTRAVGSAPPTGQTAPDAGKSSEKRPRRAFARPGLLAGAGAAVVLIVALTVILLARTHTTPSATVILKDSFSSRVSGWTVVPNSAYGRYGTSTYQIRAAPRGDIEVAVPAKVRDLYPSAPSQLSISVTAGRIAGPAQDALYGIVCREADDNAYGFGVENNTVVIFKLTNGAYRPLIPVRTALGVRVNGTNQLRAVFTSAGTHAAVHLTFWVNSQKLLSAIDKNDPLTRGTIGLFAATNSSDKNMVAGAEFTNLVVTRI